MHKYLCSPFREKLLLCYSKSSQGVGLVPDKLMGILHLNFMEVEKTLQRFSMVSFLSSKAYISTTLPLQPSSPSGLNPQLIADPAAQLWHLQESWMGWGGHFLERNLPVFSPPWLSLTRSLYKNSLLYETYLKGSSSSDLLLDFRLCLNPRHKILVLISFVLQSGLASSLLPLSKVRQKRVTLFITSFM